MNWLSFKFTLRHAQWKRLVRIILPRWCSTPPPEGGNTLTIELSQPKVSREWLTTANQYHYPHDRPAYTTWHSNGQKKYENYSLNNQYHRENDKPAYTNWHSSGRKVSERYYISNQLHRINDKPAYIYGFIDGKGHYESYYLNGIHYTPRKTTC